MWLDPPVSIDTQLIARIIGLSKAGEDQATLLTNKAGEKALAKSMKDKFHTFIGKRLCCALRDAGLSLQIVEKMLQG